MAQTPINSLNKALAPVTRCQRVLLTALHFQVRPAGALLKKHGLYEGDE